MIGRVRSIKSHYFLAFAVMGSVLPYLPLYLRQRGLDKQQLGIVLGVGGLAIILTPVLVTLLADVRLKSRTLLAILLAIVAGSLFALLSVGAFWALLLFYALHALAFTPIIPIQDGLLFFLQGRQREAGQPVTPYHRVRVWGTLGFMAPSFLLWWLLKPDRPAQIALVCAVGVTVLTLVNSFALPAITSPAKRPAIRRSETLPTLDAVKAMLEPHVLVFVIAMWLVALSITAYYGFYPLLLTEELGIADRWVGLIMTLGVGLEVFYMLSFGRLLRRMGLRRLMVLGTVCMIVRFALLGTFINIGVAVGTQVFHGMMVLVVHVAPPIYINHHAEDRFRNSMQGLFTMVIGSGRVLGAVLAGIVAERELTWVFLYAAALAALACALFAVAFHDRTQHDVQP